MDNQIKSDIMTGLALLKESLIKEYSLNTSPKDVKGENASDTNLPADWQEKLKPLSGGPEGGHEGDSGPEKKNTSTGSQGSDPYIHKELSEMKAAIAMLSKQMMGENMAMGNDEESPEDEMMWDKEDVGSEENGEEGFREEEVMEEEDEMAKMGTHGDMYKDMEGEEMGNGDDSDMAQIVDALNQIKGILTQADFQKQQALSIEKSVDAKLTTFAKEINKTLANRGASQVSDTVKQILKSQGFAPVVSESPVRVSSNVAISKSESVPEHSLTDDSSEMLQKSADNKDVEEIANIHNNFVAQVDEIAGKTDVEDLKGTFRLLNYSRQQMQGGDLTTPLWYYK